jgi:hypothetical protein
VRGRDCGSLMGPGDAGLSAVVNKENFFEPSFRPQIRPLDRRVSTLEAKHGSSNQILIRLSVPTSNVAQIRRSER